MQDSGVVRFGEQQRVLRLYAEAIAGRPVDIRCTDEASTGLQLAGHDLPIWNGETLYLPASIEELGSERSNFSAYKIAVLHQLGYEKAATLDLEWKVCEERFDFSAVGRSSRRGSADAGSRPRTSFERLFAAFGRPQLARWLFSVLEDARVDAVLLRRYKGIRAELAELMSHSLQRRPHLGELTSSQAVLEGLVQLTLGAELWADLPSSLHRPLSRIQKWVFAVQRPDADVYTTAEVTIDCYRLFRELEAHRWHGLPKENRLPASPEAPAAEAASSTSSEAGNVDSAPPDDDAAEEPLPVPYRGVFNPELLQKQVLLEQLTSELESLQEESAAEAAGFQPPTAQEVTITSVEDGDGGGGRPATELDLRAEEAHNGNEREQDLERGIRALEKELGREPGDSNRRGAQVYLYDEWSHLQSSYLRDWCTLNERLLEKADAASLRATLESSADLLRDVRRQFELLKPELMTKVRRLLDGEEIDLDSAIEARIDRRTGNSVLEKVYVRRQKRERDVAAAFLLDMSASTDSEITEPPPTPVVGARGKLEPDYTGILGDEDDWAYFTHPRPTVDKRRVIDVEKEAVLLMAESLDVLGDEYAIYGFSGFGRKDVDFFVAKDFGEAYGEAVQQRIAAMKPQRSTRMGPAIRHTIRKLATQDARIKALIILSDGYPQDFDYGDDRGSREYGIQDTMMALREAQLRGVHSFCITVDPAGHDYLREMCPDRQYMVIDDIAALPRELPKVYRALTR